MLLCYVRSKDAPFVVRPGAPFVANIAPSSDALVTSSVLVTTSKALVTRSDALVPSSEPCS